MVILAAAGSVVILLLSLFLFLIPEKELRVKLYFSLIAFNIIFTILVFFNPLDFGFIGDIQLWYHLSEPFDGYASLREFYIQGGYNVPSDISYFNGDYKAPLGLTAILNIALYNIGLIKSHSVLVLFDLLGFFGYFKMYLLLSNEE